MAFKEQLDLDSETTTALGGRNKQTGKANPTKAEGYYLGTKQVESPRSKTGKSALHILQTASGNLGVWGKTDLDRKMLNVTPGTMVRITQNGMQEIPGKNPMYKFKVEVDAENTIEVNFAGSAASNDADAPAYGDDDVEESSYDSEESEPAPRAAAPRKTVSAPTPGKAHSLLSGISRK